MRQYFLNYHSGCTVNVQPTDFRTTKERRAARLGAFEIDARLRVDGKLATYNVWSKLHTGRWPRWPDWQDGVRQMIPIFQLLLRPCALRSDGSAHYLPHARVQVINHDGSRTLLDQSVEHDASTGTALAAYGAASRGVAGCIVSTCGAIVRNVAATCGAASCDAVG